MPPDEGSTNETLSANTVNISVIITAQSGLPFTVVTSAFDASGLGNVTALIAGNRTNLICDPNEGAPRTLEQWSNTACFQPDPPTTATSVANVPGNAARGVVNGPPTYRVDFSPFKNVRFSESLRLQLRGEVCNIFNHTNFRGFVGTPNSLNVTSANFGRIGSVRDPRTVQLGAKFYF